MERLKAGIIGAGGIAQTGHIPYLKKMEGVDVVALCDPNAKKLKAVAAQFAIPRTFSRYEDLLAEELDFVCVCSPNVFHAPQSIAALKTGKHVLCEKPVALNAAEARKILETADKTGKIFMGAFVQRFTAHGQMLRKMAVRGEFGEIYYAKAGYLRRRGIPGLRTWFTTRKLAGGGPLIDVGVHILDLALYVMGCPEPKTVLATTYNKFRKNAVDGGWPPADTRIGDKPTGVFDVEDLATAFVKFRNGSTLLLEASWAGNSETGFALSLFGTRAGAQYRSESVPPLKIYQEILGITSDTTPQLGQVDPFGEEHVHFINCVRKGMKPLTTPKEILTTAKILEGIYRSAKKGAAVEFT
jgi:predicted dehydrogenase